MAVPDRSCLGSIPKESDCAAGGQGHIEVFVLGTDWSDVF